jgi:hypothetical protein
MREFAGRKLRSITTQDIQRFLAGIDREDVSARTVNIHRDRPIGMSKAMSSGSNP